MDFIIGIGFFLDLIKVFRVFFVGGISATRSWLYTLFNSDF